MDNFVAIDFETANFTQSSICSVGIVIVKADAIVIGAPCFWGNIPGQLKLLFDRIVYGMMRDTPRFPEPLMRGKKAVFISTCTTPWPFNILMNQSHEPSAH